MISIENDIFTAVAETLRANFPGIFVVGEYIPVPAKLPAAMLYEADNYVLASGSTSRIENYARVTYFLSVFSNKTVGKKSEAKAISDAADEALAALGFTRISRMQVPNMADATIFRLESRYEAVIGPGLESGTYQIYQNT